MLGWTRNERGNVAVMFAAGALAITALGAGALSMARLNGTGVRLQDVADGAALAAAVQAQDPRASEADVRLAAQRFSDTAVNAGEAERAAMTVTLVKRSPAEVTVTLDQRIHTILAGMVGRDHIAIRRRATAVSGAARTACLHVLEPAAPGALTLQGNPRVSAPDCVVLVNSTAPGALRLQGSASANAQAAYVAGPAWPAKGFTPPPLFGQAPQADPLAGRIQWPAPSSCDPGLGDGAVAATLRPGVYCAGLRLGNGAELKPGVYVIRSGGVSVEGRGAHGRGVTLVILDGAGSFEIKGPATLRIAAPAEGPWAGVAIAAKPGPGLVRSKIGGELDLEGLLYLPGHELLLQGNARIGGTAATRAVVVRRLLARGTPDLNLAGGHPTGAYGSVRLSR